MINFATVGTNFVVDWFIKATSKCDSLKYKGTYSRNINKAKSSVKSTEALFSLMI